MVRWDVTIPIVLQQVCVQVFAPILLVAVTTGPDSSRYSAVLHELGMGIHHSPLFRAPLRCPRIVPQHRAICDGDVCSRYHAAPGFPSLADLNTTRDTEVLRQIHLSKETNPLCGVLGRQFDLVHSRRLHDALCFLYLAIREEGVGLRLSSAVRCLTFLRSATNRL